MEYWPLIDGSDPPTLEVQNQDRTVSVEGSGIRERPVYGRIAAGPPIHMNSEIGEEATLKKFNRMGNNILLISENPSDEPTLLREGQVSVLGVAVGLIKVNHIDGAH